METRGPLRMRGDPNIICAESSVESQPPFVSYYLSRTVEQARIRQLAVRASLLLLQPGLQEIERQAKETREESGDRAGTKSPLRLAQ